MYNELNLENLQEPMVTLNKKGEARVTFNDYTDLSIGAKSLLRLCLNGLYAIGNKDSNCNLWDIYNTLKIAEQLIIEDETEALNLIRSHTYNALNHEPAHK
jgi:hypothetical protein